MANDPLDILSIAEFKQAVRFTGDSSHDGLIETNIRAALDYIDERTACGVLDRRVEYTASYQQSKKPLRIPLRFNATLSDLHYGYPTRDEPPTTAIPTTSVTAGVGKVDIAPPEGGWLSPTVVLTATMSIRATHVPPILKQAAILLTQRLYDGDNVDAGDWAVNSLIAPYMSQRRAAPNLEISTVVPTEHSVAPTRVPIYVGWSADLTITADELTRGTDHKKATAPKTMGALHLLIWRADSEGGDPRAVKLGISDRDRRNDFGQALPLTIDSIPGRVIATVYAQNAGLLSGIAVEVE